jgi:Recombination endonuclease VII
MKIDHSATERQCTAHCGKTLKAEEYEWADAAHTRRRGDCKDCQYDKAKERIRNDRRSHLRRQRINNLKHKYGLSLEQWTDIYNRQDGNCPICGKEVDVNDAVDHDHGCCQGQGSCGECVRGILHTRCNSLLGFAGDDPEMLQAAINYLRKYHHD